VSDEHGHAISFRLLEAGTPVHAVGGEHVGTVVRVLHSEREQIFDGVVIQTPRGPRFVDAPEIGRIVERRVTLTIDIAQAELLPEPGPAPVEYRADPGAGRLRRMLGGGWRRR